MILHVSPDAPVLVQVAAAGLLAAHIGGAAVALVSGGAAMVFAKGGRAHRLAGNVFFVAMLAMAGVAAGVAPFLPKDQAPNTMVGIFTVYLVATAWAAVKRRAGQIGRFEVGAFAVALAAALAAIVFGWVNAHSAHPLRGPEAMAPIVVGVLASLAAACDVNLIRRGGLVGADRIARHLWRMSLALFIAVGSFAGQPKAIPEFLRGSPLLFLPMLAVLAAMTYWLIRVRLPRRSSPAKRSEAGEGNRAPEARGGGGVEAGAYR